MNSTIARRYFFSWKRTKMMMNISCFLSLLVPTLEFEKDDELHSSISFIVAKKEKKRKKKDDDE